MTDLPDILANPAFWIAVLRIATPLILGTLGVLLCERAGVLNLGIEGILVVGALSYFGYRVNFPKVTTPPTITPFAEMACCPFPFCKTKRRSRCWHCCCCPPSAIF